MRAFAFPLALLLSASSAFADTQIRIVGSSTVFPFTTMVTEYYSKIYGRRAPVVEQTGTGAGMKLFCAGLGENTPDMVNASRTIKPGEMEKCNANGVDEILEFRVGFDGIVVGTSKEAEAFNVTPAQLFQALAKKVAHEGEIIDNPYKNWQEIDAGLPDRKIQVYGPPPTSGTRDAFVELGMHPGCEAFEVIHALPDADKDLVCSEMREDGVYIEAGESDNVIIQRLQTNPQAVGIFGFSFLDQNAHLIHALPVAGVEATFENIASSVYAISRSLFVYVKKKHLEERAEIKDLMTEYLSENAVGEEGYLVDKGLIPLLSELRQAERARLETLDVITLPSSEPAQHDIPKTVLPKVKH